MRMKSGLLDRTIVLTPKLLLVAGQERGQKLEMLYCLCGLVKNHMTD